MSNHNELQVAHSDMLLLGAYIIMTTKQPDAAVEKLRLDIRKYLVEQGLVIKTDDDRYRLRGINE